MVGLDGIPPTTANNGSQPYRGSDPCDHKCAVITLSVVTPILSLILVSLLLFGLRQRRREKSKNKSKDEEKEIAMRKLGPDSETSSMTEGFGDVPAVTNLEDGAEVVRELGKPSKSWRPGNMTSKTPGWWRM